MIKRLFIVWVTVGRTFGLWVRPIGTFFMLMTLRTVVATGMTLDWLFVPGLRKTRLERPIVLVGYPRAGTTFFHRFLVDAGLGAGLRIYEMLFPSLILRRMVRPFLPLMERFSPARHHSSVAKEINLTSVEADDASLIFRFFDGWIPYAFFFCFAEKDYREMFMPEHRDTSRRDFAWFERIWRDNSLHHPRHRVVAKAFSMGLRMPEFMERFPDARMLYMVRDPLEVIPSTLSFATSILDKAFGFWKLPEEVRARYIERLYGALIHLYKASHDDWVSGRVPRDRAMVVRFDRMMKDFDGLMEEVLALVGVDKTPELEAEIQRVAAEQRKFESKHKYDGKKFGIAAERIKKDCAFVYETFFDGAPAHGEPPKEAAPPTEPRTESAAQTSS
jgi:hypothetical protein